MTAYNQLGVTAGPSGTIPISAGVSAPWGFTTATYPSTTVANQLLYSTGTNAIGGLATGNNGVLITSAGGVPSVSSTLPTAVQTNITELGTVTVGTWNGGIIGPTYGGTGINNGASTITIGGNFTMSGAFSFIGTVTAATSVTFPTSGTLATTASIPALPLTMANGGTGANLSPSNGGIFYSNATTGAILSGTATAEQVLLSSASSAPVWSTATYPVTTTINQLLYSSAANTITGLATNNSSVLITSAGGVPSLSTSLPSGVTANITSLGTITAGTWNGSVIGLAYGGTNANLTASNGGIFYSTASAGAILAATATSSQVLLSGASSAPFWSTATYPSSTSLNTILYSSSANVINQIAAGNSGTLVTSSTGVPSIQTLTAGQILIGTTAAAPTATTLTAGANVTISSVSGSITISASSSGGGLTWVTQTAATVTMAANHGYFMSRGSAITATIPATATIGDTIQIVTSRSNVGSTTIAQNASDQIFIYTSVTTLGVGGSLANVINGATITLVSSTTGGSGNVWFVTDMIGDWTIV